jgi:hypothetical protein
VDPLDSLDPGLDRFSARNRSATTEHGLREWVGWDGEGQREKRGVRTSNKFYKHLFRNL